MLTGRVSSNPLDALEPVLSGEEIVEAQAAVRQVQVGQAVADILCVWQRLLVPTISQAGSQPPRRFSVDACFSGSCRHGWQGFR